MNLHRHRLRPELYFIRGHGRAPRHPDHAASRSRYRGDALSAVANRGQLREIRVSEKHHRLLGYRRSLHGTGAKSIPRSAASMPVATGQHRSPADLVLCSAACCRSIRSPRARRGPLPSGRLALRRRGRLFPRRAIARHLPTGCNLSGCVNMSASEARTTYLIFASAGWCALRLSRVISVWPSKLTMPAIRCFGRVGQMMTGKPDRSNLLRFELQ